MIHQMVEEGGGGGNNYGQAINYAFQNKQCSVSQQSDNTMADHSL